MGLGQGGQGESGPRGGTYSTYAEIASGGMATVHLGRLSGAHGFSRTVAIKVLHASYAKNETFVTRFLDEARLVGRIHHPNVMPTLDVLSDEAGLRIVMEYVAGESLDRLETAVSERRERIPVRVACAIVSGALHGLHAAHEAKNEFGEPLGIVHLDVSPQNILVGVDGTARVLDFGVAKARGARVDPLITGKSAYLSPEQVRGAEVSRTTDVFAASVVLWEMLTGESLFATDNHAATMQKVLGAVIPDVSDKVPELPPRLDDVLRRGLRRDPSQRFATARDMALELEKAVPPALASEVGAWVELVAEGTLNERAAKVREMEARATVRPPPVPGLVPTRAFYEDHAAANLGSVQATALAVTLESSAVPPPRAAVAAPVGLPIKTAPMTAVPVPRSRPSVPRRSRRSRMLLFITAVTTIVVLGLVSVGARALYLPSYVSSAVIDAAAARGVVLTVEGAELSDDGVLLRGLSAGLAGVPGIRATLATADVEIDWLTARRVVLGKTDIQADGPAHVLASALEKWSTAQSAKGGGPLRTGATMQLANEAIGEDDSATRFEVQGAHLSWTHPSDRDLTRVEATGVQGDVTPTSTGVALHLMTRALIVTARAGALGPWGASFDWTAKGARARIAFDPAVPDGANALYLGGAAGDSSLDVTVPRMSVAALGIPKSTLGDGALSPEQVEMRLHYTSAPRGQTAASLRTAAYGIHLPELGGSLEAHLSAQASGPSGGTLTLKDGVFSVGPVKGTVTGTVVPESGSFRGDLAWKGEPVPCGSLLTLPAPGAAAIDLAGKAQNGSLGDLGELARDLGSIGQAVGAIKLTGTFSASGTIDFDSADIGGAKFGVSAKNACGISLFQGKGGPP